MNNPLEMLSMLQQLRQNPASVLSRYGVPQNIMNDPQAVIQNLMNRGQISQEQYNQAVKTAQQMRGMFR